MVVLNREDYFARLNTMIADNSSDEAIQFLEDMSDTYNDMEHRIEGDGTDWETRYHDLDNQWKERYKKRFFAGGTNNPNEKIKVEEDEDEYDPENVNVNDLFIKKEGN